MEFQWVKVAFPAALACLAASCASAPRSSESVAQIVPPAPPAVLSRLEIARNYRFAPAPMVAAGAGADADPSFALSHEIQELQPQTAHAQAGAPLPPTAILTAGELPKGWTRARDQLIKHRESGLACPISIEITDEKRRFLLHDIEAFDEAGLDVGCNYATDTGAFLTLYASYWPEMSLDDAMAGAIAAIRQRFEVEGELPAPIATISGEAGDPLYEGLEEPKAAAFDVGEVAGAPYKTAVWVVKTYGWHVKARATYPQSDQTSEIVSALMFAVSHLNVRAKNMTRPTSAGSEV